LYIKQDNPVPHCGTGLILLGFLEEMLEELYK